METATDDSLKPQSESSEIKLLRAFFMQLKEKVDKARTEARVEADAKLDAKPDEKTMAELKAAAEIIEKIPEMWREYNQAKDLTEFVVITLPHDSSIKEIFWANFKVQLFQYFLTANNEGGSWVDREFESAHLRDTREGVIVFAYPEFCGFNSKAFHQNLKKYTNASTWQSLNDLFPLKLGKDNFHIFDIQKYKKEDYPNFLSKLVGLFRSEFLEWINVDKNIERFVNVLSIPYQQLILNLIWIYKHKFCNLNTNPDDHETKAFDAITFIIDNSMTKVNIGANMANFKIALEVCYNAVQEKISQALTPHFNKTIENPVSGHKREDIIDVYLDAHSSSIANWNNILSFTGEYRFACTELENNTTVNQVLLAFQDFTGRLAQEVADDLYWAARRRLWKAILVSLPNDSALKIKMQTMDFYQSDIIQAINEANQKKLILMQQLAVVAILTPVSFADIIEYFDSIYSFTQEVLQHHITVFNTLSEIILTHIAHHLEGRFLVFALCIRHIYGELLFAQFLDSLPLSNEYYEMILSPIKHYVYYDLANIQGMLHDIPEIFALEKNENYFRKMYRFYFCCVYNPYQALTVFREEEGDIKFFDEKEFLLSIQNKLSSTDDMKNLLKTLRVGLSYIAVLQKYKKRNDYQLVLNPFANPCSGIHLDKPFSFYPLTCFYIAYAELQANNLDVASSLSTLAEFLEKYVIYKIGLQEAETLRYMLMPVGDSSVENLGTKRQQLQFFLKESVTEMKKLDDVLVVNINIQPKKWFSLSSVLSADKPADSLMKIYKGHLQDWYDKKPGAAMPMNYPVVFVYRSHSKQGKFKCIEIYETCDRHNTIVRNTCSIEASYLLARAARFVSKDAKYAKPGSIQNILYQLKNKAFGILRLQFDINFFDAVLKLVRESMRVMRECYLGPIPITKALLKNPGDNYDDPRILLRCKSEVLIGYCIIACLCRKLREKRDVAYSQVVSFLYYVENFFSTIDKVYILGGPQGVVKSNILKNVPSHLKQFDFLKIDPELFFESGHTIEYRQGACLRWFNSLPKSHEANVLSSVNTKLHG
jgi:hypothetical protein